MYERRFPLATVVSVCRENGFSWEVGLGNLPKLDLQFADSSPEVPGGEAAAPRQRPVSRGVRTANVGDR